ncbi:hypothetical protein PINS_up004567 [Pythium insidiosum]|nr:hypothetical protein PINS_up004567 [Pythium insidiosum]
MNCKVRVLVLGFFFRVCSWRLLIVIRARACIAVGSLGDASDRTAFLELPTKLSQLKYIGLGVTESGLCPNSPVIKDLAAFLWHAAQALPSEFVVDGISNPRVCLMDDRHSFITVDNKLSVINTDNVPNNGALIKRYEWHFSSIHQ